MNILKNLLGKNHKKYWEDRKIDWKTSYFDTWNHPHRYMISGILKKLQWDSLFEVGCGAGANFANILSQFRGKVMHLGGNDVNADAIEFAEKQFAGAFLKVGTAEDIMMSDNSTDIIISDMTLIYVKDINKALKEIKRVARSYILLCELHSESFYGRMKERWRSGYYVRNYKKLLTKHGFTNIQFIKIPKEAWDGKPQVPFGYIILAKVPKY